MSREISLAEVKKHNTDNSCWLVIHSNVYDVTKFLSEHPGGEASLLEYAGKDGTVAFEDVGHSDDAKNMMKKYKIGKLPDAERPASSSASCCRSSNARLIKKPSPPLRISPSIPSCECHSIKEDKPWRTFDDEDGKRPRTQHIPCKAKCKKAAKERRRALKCKKPKHRSKTHPSSRSSGKVKDSKGRRNSRGNSIEEESGGSNLKWALLALAAALVAGIILKKSLGS